MVRPSTCGPPSVFRGCPRHFSSLSHAPGFGPTRRGDRYVFQFGALGGSNPEEMMHGGERVETYLRRHKSDRIRWEPPPPDGTSPEAEWGFAPALREDIERFARVHDYRVQRVVFEQPEAMSPLVADLYRWWYERLGVADNRLVVD